MCVLDTILSVFILQNKNSGGIVQNPEMNYNRLIYDGSTSPSSVKTAQNYQFHVIINFFFSMLDYIIENNS